MIEFLLLQFHGAVGYIVVMEMSLELIPHDGVDIYMGVTVCLPPIFYRTKELVHGKKNLLMIPWLVRRWCGEFAGTPPNETGVVVEVEVLVACELVDWAVYC
jgi:hypothetical protein